MMIERNVCRSLFKEVENFFEELLEFLVFYIKLIIFVEIFRNILDVVNVFKDGNKILGLEFEDLEIKI